MAPESPEDHFDENTDVIYNNAEHIAAYEAQEAARLALPTSVTENRRTPQAGENMVFDDLCGGPSSGTVLSCNGENVIFQTAEGEKTVDRSRVLPDEDGTGWHEATWYMY